MRGTLLTGLLLSCWTMALTGCHGTGATEQPATTQATTKATTRQSRKENPPEPVAYKDRVTVKGAWPTLFGSSIDQPVTITTPDGKSSTLTIRKIEDFFEPDLLTGKTPDHKTYLASRVTVDVDGQPAVLTLRGYQVPVTVGNVRLSVESTRNWMEHFSKDTGWNFPVSTCDAVFSAVPAGQTWGPADFKFPIQQYRWRSSTYRNTWSALVPFNTLYYHAGEDFGAIPDHLNLQVAYPGKVIATPYPDGDGKSNWLEFDVGSGVTYGYAHMNIESIDPAMKLDAKVAPGDHAAQTGETWQGQKSQQNDPHVHIEFSQDQRGINGFETLVEAYFRDYDDSAIAVAGGFGFVNLGDSYTLDGTRSQARPGRKITSYKWILHTGKEVEGPITEMKFDQMGYFAEELVIKTDDGHEDRDSIHIKVEDVANNNPGTATGWASYTPTRNIVPGQEITFWRRLAIDGDATVDFGDGTTLVSKEGGFTHAYSKPGIYTVTIRGASGPNKDPIVHKLRVVVDGQSTETPLNK